MITKKQLQEVPIVVEFVSVPTTFDLDLCLSMRESAGWIAALSAAPTSINK